MAQIFQSDRARAPGHAAGRHGAGREGPEHTRLTTLQAMADAGGSGREAATVQRQAEEEEPMQGKARGEALQRKAEEEEPLQGKARADTLQRQPEEEEPLQGKARGEALQRQPEEEEPLQGKAEGAALQRQEAEEESVQMKPSGGGAPLPRQLQTGIESLSGRSMDHVRVHHNSSQPAAVGAHAFAQGADIHLAPGQEQHLPHEAWHTVQQAEGRVAPTTEVAGVAVNDSPSLEHEADTMGNKAAGK